jgi:ATP synthase protein I
MPFNRPIPNSKEPSKMQGGVSAIVEAEKLLQIALVLPCAAVIGWLIGAWADKHFQQTWISIAGIVFGAISGLVFVIRMALSAERNSRAGADTQNGTGSSETKQ